MCGCSAISVQPLFSGCLFCSYYITRESLSLECAGRLSGFFFVLFFKREIRFSKIIPTKGKCQDSSREGKEEEEEGGGGVVKMRRGTEKVAGYLVKSLGGEAGGRKCRHAESESSLLMG